MRARRASASAWAGRIRARSRSRSSRTMTSWRREGLSGNRRNWPRASSSLRRSRSSNSRPVATLRRSSSSWARSGSITCLLVTMVVSVRKKPDPLPQGVSMATVPFLARSMGPAATAAFSALAGGADREGCGAGGGEGRATCSVAGTEALPACPGDRPEVSHQVVPAVPATSRKAASSRTATRLWRGTAVRGSAAVSRRRRSLLNSYLRNNRPQASHSTCCSCAWPHFGHRIMAAPFRMTSKDRRAAITRRTVWV